MQRTNRPLRKIVSRYSDGVRLIEVLECGHHVRQKQDIYGPTNAYRRRCRFCGAASVSSKALPPH